MIYGEDLIEELSGMAARRIAVLRNRASGMSWSQARKASLTVTPDEEIKNSIRNALAKGMEPKEAVYGTVELCRIYLERESK